MSTVINGSKADAVIKYSKPEIAIEDTQIGDDTASDLNPADWAVVVTAGAVIVAAVWTTNC